MEKVIRPFRKQAEAASIASQNFVTLYGGAIRGGKSYWLLLLIFTYASMYPKSRWAVLRASYATLQSTLMITFYKLMDEGLGSYIKSCTVSSALLYNGSEIIFFSENYAKDKDHNRFRGLEVNGFGIDEINEIQYSTFLKCIERSGSWQGSNAPPKILGTCNPSRGWVKEVFYDKWEVGGLPNGYAYVPAKITDNPVVASNKAYMESLTTLPPQQYEMFVEGNWNVKMDGLLFYDKELNYFNPNEIKSFDSSLAYVDVADEGGDATSCVVGRNIMQKVYITDVVFNKSNSDVTIPLVASLVESTNVSYIRVESNAMGAMYYRTLSKSLVKCKAIPATSTSNKHTRILMDAAFIKKFFVFVEPKFQSQEYKAFMNELLMYNQDGSSKHDDSPDALSGLAMFIRGMLSHLY